MGFDNDVLDEFLSFNFFKKNPEKINIFFKYLTARVDLKNFGNMGNNLIFLENSDSDCEVYTPHWFKNIEGTGWIIHSKKGSIDLKVKCVNDGKFNLYLRGLDYRDNNNNRILIYINYTKLVVNGLSIFDKELTISHDRSYNFAKDVKNNEIIDIHIEWEPFD